MQYKITQIWDDSINSAHHITVNTTKILTVLYLENISMVDFLVFLIGGVGGELGQLSDTFWNMESLSRALKSKKAAKVIAMAIAEFSETEE